MLCWFFAANERGRMLPGFRTPGLILFDEILLGETLAYVETILTSEPSLFVARHQLSLPTRGGAEKSRMFAGHGFQDQYEPSRADA